MTRLLRGGDVIERLGISKSTLYAMVADGRFPGPIRVGTRAVRWRESDIDAWLAERAAERTAEIERRYGPLPDHSK